MPCLPSTPCQVDLSAGCPHELWLLLHRHCHVHHPHRQARPRHAVAPRGHQQGGCCRYACATDQGGSELRAHAVAPRKRQPGGCRPARDSGFIVGACPTAKRPSMPAVAACLQKPRMAALLAAAALVAQQLSLSVLFRTLCSSATVVALLVGPARRPTASSQYLTPWVRWPSHLEVGRVPLPTPPLLLLPPLLIVRVPGRFCCSPHASHVEAVNGDHAEHGC